MSSSILPARTLGHHGRTTTGPLRRAHLNPKSTRSGGMDDLVIAVVMFDGAEEQDVVGPYEMFWWMSLFEKLPPAQPISESDFLTTFTSRKGAWPNPFTVAPTTDAYC